MFPEVTVLRKRIIQLLVFSFPFQIPRNFKFLFAQTIVFDLGAIWNFPTIYYQAFIFQNLYSQDHLDFLSQERIFIR